MLKVDHLQASYGRVKALWDVSFEVQAGEIVALIGANGAGKTTTLRTVSALIKPDAGTITLDSQPLDGCTSMEVVRRGLVHVPEARGLFPEMTVLDNLMMGAYSTPTAGRNERLEKVYGIFPVVKERQKQIAGTLSGGEQQMVSIGRGLMADPKLLMLDEPSLGLAPIMVEEMFRVVKQINATGVAILLVEQNTQHALSLAKRGYVLESGRAVLSGSGKELLENEAVRKAYLGL